MRNISEYVDEGFIIVPNKKTRKLEAKNIDE